MAEPLRGILRNPYISHGQFLVAVICDTSTWIPRTSENVTFDFSRMRINRRRTFCSLISLNENIIIDEDNFDIDGMLADPVVVQTRLEDLIKWNPASECIFRAAYTGDRRASKYRKHNAKETTLCENFSLTRRIFWNVSVKLWLDTKFLLSEFFCMGAHST